MTSRIVIVRGGGDLATGTIWMLHRAGFRVLVTESEKPSAIRRTVSFCEAVYEGTQTVEGVTARLVRDLSEAEAVWAAGEVAVMVDAACEAVTALAEAPVLSHPSPGAGCDVTIAVVDAIMAKRNLGTRMDMAPFVIALGPGFTAGKDCHAVVETMRGHNLGRVYYEGSAEPNTGIPGLIAGYDADRVIHAPCAGVFHAKAAIGDLVKQGDVIGVITPGADDAENPRAQEEKERPVTALIDGLLRGILHDGYPVTKGFKLADIDPRANERDNCHTISDKARTIGGGVLCAVMESMTRYNN